MGNQSTLLHPATEIFGRGGGGTALSASGPLISKPSRIARSVSNVESIMTEYHPCYPNVLSLGLGVDAQEYPLIGLKRHQGTT